MFIFWKEIKRNIDQQQVDLLLLPSWITIMMFEVTEEVIMMFRMQIIIDWLA
jgi:hypothetical protein